MEPAARCWRGVGHRIRPFLSRHRDTSSNQIQGYIVVLIAFIFDPKSRRNCHVPSPFPSPLRSPFSEKSPKVDNQPPLHHLCTNPLLASGGRMQTACMSVGDSSGTSFKACSPTNTPFNTGAHICASPTSLAARLDEGQPLKGARTGPRDTGRRQGRGLGGKGADF